jgi:hypothetical protein
MQLKRRAIVEEGAGQDSEGHVEPHTVNEWGKQHYEGVSCPECRL